MLRISMCVLLIVESMEGGFISEPYTIDQLYFVVGVHPRDLSVLQNLSYLI